MPLLHDEHSATGRMIRISQIAPVLVMICFGIDLALRFLPPEQITFRAWESMTVFAVGDGPFVPRATYRNPRSYGDLSSAANLPQLRQYREDEFHTDAAGYRNRVEPATPFQGVLVVGDSFAAGAGITDDLTLGEQLSKVSGCTVYNGAMSTRFWELFDELQMKGGLVIWQQSERTPLLVSAETASSTRKRLVTQVFGSDWGPRLLRGNRYVQSFLSYSPFQILSSRTLKFLQDDRVLPNPYRGEAVVARLRNGREMLFLPSELSNYHLDRATDPAGFIDLQAKLARQGVRLLVLLVPDKYAVYRELLAPDEQRGPTRRPYLDLVEQSLRAANIPVVNLTSRFRARAADLLPRDQYIYWLDDTHWNEAGIREAVDAVTERSLGCRGLDSR